LSLKEPVTELGDVIVELAENTDRRRPKETESKPMISDKVHQTDPGNDSIDALRSDSPMKQAIRGISAAPNEPDQLNN